jgi:hypothetical protein
MPLSSSRFARLIENAKASPNVSHEELEALRKAARDFELDGFNHPSSPVEVVEDTGDEVWISTGPMDQRIARRLARKAKEAKTRFWPMRVFQRG